MSFSRHRHVHISGQKRACGKQNETESGNDFKSNSRLLFAVENMQGHWLRRAKYEVL